jgi:hypothetical protein
MTLKEGVMSSGQIDMLCWDWLRENYGERIASQYTPYSLLVPRWNADDLNDALDKLIGALSFAFGPEQSFRGTDYYEARAKLELADHPTRVPDVFIRAFAAG